MDTTQLLLTIILSLTTFLLIVVGVQLIFVLRELRKTIIAVRRIIGSFESLGVGLDNGFHEVVGFLNGFKTIFKLIETVSGRKNEKSK
ncbi:MAG: hypothetical protein RI947_10 [Candidatus Parcubacteria bacterium]|jgi:hypothetical protein